MNREDCGPNLIRLIAKGYAKIVSDVSIDVSDVSEEIQVISDITTKLKYAKIIILSLGEKHIIKHHQNIN